MATDRHLVWERRQEEIWDRIFQATQDIAVLAEAMGTHVGESIVRTEMVKAAMAIGAELVRANAAHDKANFLHHLDEARLKAVETDYWLRLGYMVQTHESLQRDVSSVITQYAAIVDLLQKFIRHAEGEENVLSKHTHGPRVS